jgi:PhoH-like ATPase
MHKKSLGKIKIILNETPNGINAEELFGKGKFDHRILNSALVLKEENPASKVILVSKDICLRLKAKSLNLYAEDYETGKIKNVDELYTGNTDLPCNAEVIDKLRKETAIDSNELSLNYTDRNHFYKLKHKNKREIAFFDMPTKKLRKVNQETVFGIEPKNAEQAFAIDALLNPAIKLVTIQGNAGTGKTLLALASALEQRKNFRQIYITRPIVPLSNKDIGFLPGDVKSKVDPYMAPIWDNLKFIKEQFSNDEKMLFKIDELIRTEKIAIAPLAFIRGRTITKIFFIVDEAQNLTPHEIKTIISRAGEHTKIVFTGDIYQIDTPYLDSESNGLSYLIENAKHHPLYAHVTLQKGERSELANLATELL